MASPEAPPEMEWDVVDSVLQRLDERKNVWGQLKPSERLVYLKDARKQLLSKVDGLAWSTASAKLQGWNVENEGPAGNPGKRVAAQEYGVTMITIKFHLDGLIATYQALVKAGDVYDAPAPAKLKVRQAADGRCVVQPESTLFEWAQSVSLELYIQEGHDPRKEGRSLNLFAGKTCLSLGAGNQTFLTVCDVLHKLFADGQPVLLKHHPLRAFSYEPFGILFSKLIADGFFGQVVCSLDIVQRLNLDPRIEAVHMTGGKPTHDAIVRGWRDAGIPDKPFSSELGNVTPWIVASGGAPWSQGEIERNINQLMVGVVGQESCNCLSPKVLVLDADWPQRGAYIECVKAKARAARLPPAYYPGTRERYKHFVDSYAKPRAGVTVTTLEAQHAEGLAPSIGKGGDPREPLPILLIEHEVDMEDESSLEALSFKTEAFAPVLAVAYIKGGKNDTAISLAQATSFANDHLFGTLSATLVVHSSLMGTPAVEAALDRLRYGAIGVNTWTAFAYLLPNGVWGGYPGESIDNVQSGIGFVHNCLMLRNVEKSVVRLPFTNGLQADQTSSQEGPSPLVMARGFTLVVNPGLRSFLRLLRAFIFRS